MARTSETSRQPYASPQTDWGDDEALFADANRQLPPQNHADEVPLASARPPLVALRGERLLMPGTSAPLRRRRAGSRSSPWLWGLAGFVFGIAFWHLIGFWGFMAQVVLPTPGHQKLVAPQSLGPGPIEGQGTLGVTPGHASPVRPTRAAK
jgi:hypothetical protein